MENIDQATKKKIIDLISVLIPDAKIYLFGSRARGDHSKWSDIDIALDAGKQLPREQVDEVQSVFQATNLMYKIQVADFHIVSPEMQSAIKKEGILWKA